MMFTVIMLYLYLLLCHKPIRNILQRERAFHDCLVTHFLCLEVISDMVLPRML